MWRRFRTLWRNEQGQGLVEYCLLAWILAIGIGVGVLILVGQGVEDTLEQVASCLSDPGGKEKKGKGGGKGLAKSSPGKAKGLMKCPS